MLTKTLPLPSYELIKAHVCAALSGYGFSRADAILNLPIVAACPEKISGPLRLATIALPEWAAEHGVNGILLVPMEASNGSEDWRQVDWWLAIFLLLECWHERTWERDHGPIHSYSFRLKGWDSRAWDHAWVNRIALFMRTWCADQEGRSADDIFGTLPLPHVLMTHDVDAINKTLPIRLKQGAFNMLNAGRYLMLRQTDKAYGKFRSALQFLFGTENWWAFDKLLAMELQAGIKAHFHFYADARKKTLKRWLFDPGYSVDENRVNGLIQKIQKQGGVVGLHPNFDSWESFEEIARQRERLASVSGQPVTNCRQHWLRFSWENTWAAQEQAGIKRDTTLMFNDRPGYRASAALVWQPWNQNEDRVHFLIEQPTVLMDSHFYDYRDMTESNRVEAIAQWIRENVDVCGDVAVLWHPHTLTNDYGWSEGFQVLVNSLREIVSCQHLH